MIFGSPSRSHQISIQTESPIPNKTPQRYDVDDPIDHFASKQSQIQKQRQQQLLKQLNKLNKKLLLQLRDANKKLKQVVQKKKKRPFKKTQQQKQAPQQIKVQLSNAYKQIDAYKQYKIQLHNKQLTQPQKNKLINLQNKVKLLDNEIDGLKIRKALMNNVIRQQNKGIQQSKPADQSIASLKQQLQIMKTKIKSLKKYDIEQKEHYLGLQKYQVQLQKLLRQKMDQVLNKGEQQHDDIISQDEWKILMKQRKRIAQNQEQQLTKVQLLANQIKRQKLMQKQTLLKIKERQVDLQRLKRKFQQFNKITKSVDKRKTKYNHTRQIRNQSLPQIHDKKKQLNTAPDNPSIKIWVPPSHIQQIGVTGPQSSFYSDRKILATHNLTKVKKVQIFINSNGYPCGILASYTDSLQQKIDRNHEDIKTISQNRNSQIIIFTQDDYLKKIEGQISDKNCIHFLKLTGISGTSLKIGKEGLGKAFQLDINQQELPSRLHWAANKINGEPILSLLGCEVIPCW